MIRICSLHFGQRDYFVESKRFGESYCTLHGYSWHILPGVPYPDGRDLRWSKVPGVASILSMPDTEYVFYVDADAVVANHGNSVGRLIACLEDKDILIGEDSPNHINTGVWFARPSCLDILKFWESTPEIDPTLCHRWPVDEAGFNEHVFPKYRKRISFKSRDKLDLVNGFVHHQMTGNPAFKQQTLAVHNERSAYHHEPQK